MLSSANIRRRREQFVKANALGSSIGSLAGTGLGAVFGGPGGAAMGEKLGNMAGGLIDGIVAARKRKRDALQEELMQTIAEKEGDIGQGNIQTANMGDRFSSFNDLSMDRYNQNHLSFYGMNEGGQVPRYADGYNPNMEGWMRQNPWKTAGIGLLGVGGASAGAYGLKKLADYLTREKEIVPPAIVKDPRGPDPNEFLKRINRKDAGDSSGVFNKAFSGEEATYVVSPEEEARRLSAQEERSRIEAARKSEAHREFLRQQQELQRVQHEAAVAETVRRRDAVFGRQPEAAQPEAPVTPEALPVDLPVSELPIDAKAYGGAVPRYSIGGWLNEHPVSNLVGTAGTTIPGFFLGKHLYDKGHRKAGNAVMAASGAIPYLTTGASAYSQFFDEPKWTETTSDVMSESPVNINAYGGQVPRYASGGQREYEPEFFEDPLEYMSENPVKTGLGVGGALGGGYGLYRLIKSLRNRGATPPVAIPEPPVDVLPPPTQPSSSSSPSSSTFSSSGGDLPETGLSSFVPPVSSYDPLPQGESSSPSSGISSFWNQSSDSDSVPDFVERQVSPKRAEMSVMTEPEMPPTRASIGVQDLEAEPINVEGFTRSEMRTARKKGLSVEQMQTPEDTAKYMDRVNNYRLKYLKWKKEGRNGPHPEPGDYGVTSDDAMYWGKHTGRLKRNLKTYKRGDQLQRNRMSGNPSPLLTPEQVYDTNVEEAPPATANTSPLVDMGTDAGTLPTDFDLSDFSSSEPMPSFRAPTGAYGGTVPRYATGGFMDGDDDRPSSGYASLPWWAYPAGAGAAALGAYGGYKLYDHFRDKRRPGVFGKGREVALNPEGGMGMVTDNTGITIPPGAATPGFVKPQLSQQEIALNDPMNNPEGRVVSTFATQAAPAAKKALGFTGNMTNASIAGGEGAMDVIAKAIEQQTNQNALANAAASVIGNKAWGGTIPRYDRGGVYGKMASIAVNPQSLGYEAPVMTRNYWVGGQDDEEEDTQLQQQTNQNSWFGGGGGDQSPSSPGDYGGFDPNNVQPAQNAGKMGGPVVDYNNNGIGSAIMDKVWRWGPAAASLFKPGIGQAMNFVSGLANANPLTMALSAVPFGMSVFNNGLGKTLWNNGPLINDPKSLLDVNPSSWNGISNAWKYGSYILPLAQNILSPSASQAGRINTIGMGSSYY